VPRPVWSNNERPGHKVRPYSFAALRPMDETIAQVLPDALWTFINEACGLPAAALRMLGPDQLPEPARRLLVHQRDMTSTLAECHNSELRVEILQQKRSDDFYLREVFLRTIVADTIVEYGVIAIAMARFLPDQQSAIKAGKTPLGGLLHRFRIPFQSSPICFFSLAAGDRVNPALAVVNHGAAYGRFNHLATPAGEPLAWIMEILPKIPRS
jgi:hypothetical protein